MMSFEMFSQFSILGSDTHRTGIEVTFTHDDATQHNQGAGGKSEFFRAEKR
ncbi:hypothetical protein SDC9_153253 [bioreactor metagenome]|uniref:Uncharacterized protein n=1 Tax=bioreactor metagenome TaxID=1076179 RepID=A0A645EXV4_9ZZZZ